MKAYKLCYCSFMNMSDNIYIHYANHIFSTPVEPVKVEPETETFHDTPEVTEVKTEGTI